MLHHATDPVETPHAASPLRPIAPPAWRQAEGTLTGSEILSGQRRTPPPTARPRASPHPHHVTTIPTSAPRMTVGKGAGEALRSVRV